MSKGGPCSTLLATSSPRSNPQHQYAQYQKRGRTGEQQHDSQQNEDRADTVQYPYEVRKVQRAVWS